LFIIKTSGGGRSKRGIKRQCVGQEEKNVTRVAVALVSRKKRERFPESAGSFWRNILGNDRKEE